MRVNETNAYCWVDIVVNNADAWVRFEGDGESDLADPSFAAKAGETNRVVILIGKTYKVTCDMPFTVVGKSDVRWLLVAEKLPTLKTPANIDGTSAPWYNVCDFGEKELYG